MTRSSFQRRPVVLTAAVAVAAAAVFGVVQLTKTSDPVVTQSAGSQSPLTLDAKTSAHIRAITAPYRDVRKALADGFIATTECVSSKEGGMGLHYVNPQRMQAPLNPDKPQILLYDAVKGGVELTGAEWFKADPDQDLRTDAGRPTLFGHAFQGPMLGHSPGMPVHFDLHDWAWKTNPKGDFMPYNPSVSCASAPKA